MTRIILDRIRAIVGETNYTEPVEDKISYSFDGIPLLQQLPEAVSFPPSCQQISQIITLANTKGFAIIPRGSGTSLNGWLYPIKKQYCLSCGPP
jgi:glycolate oxidase